MVRVLTISWNVRTYVTEQCLPFGGTPTLFRSTLFNRDTSINCFLDNIESFTLQAGSDAVRRPLAVIPGASGYGKVRRPPHSFVNKLDSAFSTLIMIGEVGLYCSMVATSTSYSLEYSVHPSLHTGNTNGHVAINQSSSRMNFGGTV